MDYPKFESRYTHNGKPVYRYYFEDGYVFVGRLTPKEIKLWEEDHGWLQFKRTLKSYDEENARGYVF